MIFEASVVVHKAIKFLVALVLLLSLHVYIKTDIFGNIKSVKKTADPRKVFCSHYSLKHK